MAVEKYGNHYMVAENKSAVPESKFTVKEKRPRMRPLFDIRIPSGITGIKQPVIS
jgi:hypothetical protein